MRVGVEKLVRPFVRRSPRTTTTSSRGRASLAGQLQRSPAAERDADYANRRGGGGLLVLYSSSFQGAYGGTRTHNDESERARLRHRRCGWLERHNLDGAVG